MDAVHGLAAILRDARQERAPQDEVQDIFTNSQVTTRDCAAKKNPASQMRYRASILNDRSWIG
jgi:hypothetical protein